MSVEVTTSACYSPFETIRTPEGMIDHSFGPYSETREHLDPWLPKLLGVLNIPSGRILELGCGRGQSAETILPFVGSDSEFILSDSDLESCIDCGWKFRDQDNVYVDHADALSELACHKDDSVSQVWYLNGIHLDEQRAQVINTSYKKLKPGGLLIANSSFTTESEPASEIRFYRRWIGHAMRKLKARDLHLHDLVKQHNTMQRLSKRDYDELFKEVGFNLLDLEPFSLSMEDEGSQLKTTINGLFRIAQYTAWIQGSMPVYDEVEPIPPEILIGRLDTVTLVQQEALLEVYPEFIGARVTPRNNAIWVARKPIRDEVIRTEPFKK